MQGLGVTYLVLLVDTYLVLLVDTYLVLLVDTYLPVLGADNEHCALVVSTTMKSLRI